MEALIARSVCSSLILIRKIILCLGEVLLNPWCSPANPVACNIGQQGPIPLDCTTVAESWLCHIGIYRTYQCLKGTSIYGWAEVDLGFNTPSRFSHKVRLLKIRELQHRDIDSNILHER